MRKKIVAGAARCVVPAAATLVLAFGALADEPCSRETFALPALSEIERARPEGANGSNTPLLARGRALLTSAETAAAVFALAGGGRGTRYHGRPPLDSDVVEWSTDMDRHDLILGAIDPDHDDSYEYRLPYGDTVSYPVIQGYGARLSHRGAEYYTVDFGMPVGTPVHAARAGLVLLPEDSHDGGCSREECGRLANFVVLLHSDGTTGEYFHLQHGSVRVGVGERVERGQLLALSGNTGYTTAPHLHFGVYRTERDGRTRSLAVRFATRGGTIAEPRMGALYMNVPRTLDRRD
jgi:murein DD-endopeptidase MepM/ murein hydrolase activator NlpD